LFDVFVGLIFSQNSLNTAVVYLLLLIIPFAVVQKPN